VYLIEHGAEFTLVTFKIVRGRIILKIILGRERGRVWTGFIWLRTGAGGKLL
jgi:hypothetical protein